MKAILVSVLLTGSLALCYWAFGFDGIPIFDVFEAGLVRTVVGVAYLVISFFVVFALAYACLSWKCDRIRLASWPNSGPLSHLCNFNVRSIAITSAVLFVIWLPLLVIFFPGVITYDGVNQLYQYSTPAPTWYSTLKTVFFEEEFIDHHPVFDTLIYGFFVYGIGDHIGSQNVGMFIFSFLQTLISAAALSISVCYLERLGIGRTFRFGSLAFFALLTVFPVSSLAMLKDSTNAPFFLLFFIMFVECVRTKGVSLQSKRFLIAFIVIAMLCMLTKKTGVYVVVISCVVMLLVLRNARALYATAIPIVVTLVLFPALVYPLVGGVAQGGKQEMLGLFFQQTTTVVKFAPEDVSDDERETIKKVFNLDIAVKRYNPDTADGPKRKFNQNASTEDLMRYFGVWASQGLRHPDLYLKSVVLCTGTLYTPIEPMTFYASINKKYFQTFEEKAATKGIEFKYDLHRPRALAPAVWNVANAWVTVSNLPVIGVLLSKGLYGGWIPIFCILIVLMRDPRRTWAYLPILVAFAFFFVSPIDDTRYAYPMIYSAPVMIGYMLWAISEERPSKAKELNCE